MWHERWHGRGASLAITGFTLAMAVSLLAPRPATAQAPAVGTTQGELEVVVDLSAREMRILLDGEVIDRWQVGIGKPGHGTPPGTYRLSRVTWNPSWTPPDSRWAQGRSAMGPGEPGNPMGRVKIHMGGLLYIHGTPEVGSLGLPVSHGCIRMPNAGATYLARLVMDHGGARKAESWHFDVLSNATGERTVEIPDPPILRVLE